MSARFRERLQTTQFALLQQQQQQLQQQQQGVLQQQQVFNPAQAAAAAANTMYFPYQQNIQQQQQQQQASAMPTRAYMANITAGGQYTQQQRPAVPRWSLLTNQANNPYRNVPPNNLYAQQQQQAFYMPPQQQQAYVDPNVRNYNKSNKRTLFVRF